MLSFWTLIAIQAVAILSGAATAAVALLIGGWGGQLALARRLTLVENRVEDTDGRITREVKRRSGEMGVAARKMTPEAQAKAHLAGQAESEAATKPGRPSVVRVG